MQHRTPLPAVPVPPTDMADPTIPGATPVLGQGRNTSDHREQSLSASSRSQEVTRNVPCLFRPRRCGNRCVQSLRLTVPNIPTCCTHRILLATRPPRPATISTTRRPQSPAACARPAASAVARGYGRPASRTRLSQGYPCTSALHAPGLTGRPQPRPPRAVPPAPPPAAAAAAAGSAPPTPPARTYCRQPPY